MTDGHHWERRSRHRTSEGVVEYRSCPCGLWRVLLDGRVVVDRIDAVAPARVVAAGGGPA